MKTYTTNYFNTFIEAAEDCPVKSGTIPSQRGNKPTVAQQQLDLIRTHPYTYTSDDVLYWLYADKNGFERSDFSARTDFFSKGQACMRASPLAKVFGWGIHFDESGKMAVYGIETQAYKELSEDTALQHTRAMRSKRA
ncbi:DUF6157 family protein [Sphingobacterium spiritivorum]|uniref:DUF6157 family protein n=1 Tax=Sphingobacterium spiritivorum TaxID=258 RepID=UPI00191AA366|nr:DUF6157 family protein [Sphingobacterium spiritivorum]QQT25463.1 hypothetical protein I6J02_17305 [Sphingobacterium spiritivorum]